MVRKIGTYFSGQYFKAADFPKPRLFTIESVGEAEVGREKDSRLVVKFKDEEKSLVLNKTNAESITEVAETDDIDQWDGIQVVLFATTTDFGGRRVDCIRARGPKGAAAKRKTEASKGKLAAEHQLKADVAEAEVDDCPF